METALKLSEPLPTSMLPIDKTALDPEKIPQHVAIIMDGNGRWAQQRGATRTTGHRQALKSIEVLTEACVELNIPFLTLYAFSTENWKRPKEEIYTLMRLIVYSLQKYMKTLLKHRIRLHCIGNLSMLPQRLHKYLLQAMNATQHFQKLQLTLAINYSGRWEILEATRKLAQQLRERHILPEDIHEQAFEKCLQTYPLPDPELLIRTSGEMRISNFLLWQIAYTEIYITPVLWPDFRKEHLYQAVHDFQQRERRFGKTSQQVS